MMRHIYRLRIGPAFFLLSLASACVEPYYPNGWQAEDAYWRANYANEPYYASGFEYGVYQPAYLYGVESYQRYHGQRFEELNDAELRSGWEQSHGRGSRLDWQHAREATHAAYNHMAQHAAPASNSSRH